MKLLPGVLLVASLSAGLSSCYYDMQSELYPTSYCDTTAVKWSSTIQPIIQVNCAYVGCHTGSTPGGGIDLSTYAGVKSSAQSGALVGSIEHAGNYTPMPNTGEKMPECTISKIRIWVDAGARED
jgi:hypothetical protein